MTGAASGSACDHAVKLLTPCIDKIVSVRSEPCPEVQLHPAGLCV